MIKKIHFETKWGWGLEKGDLGKLNSEVNKGTKCVTDKPFFPTVSSFSVCFLLLSSVLNSVTLHVLVEHHPGMS